MQCLFLNYSWASGNFLIFGLGKDSTTPPFVLSLHHSHCGVVSVGDWVSEFTVKNIDSLTNWTNWTLHKLNQCFCKLFVENPHLNQSHGPAVRFRLCLQNRQIRLWVFVQSQAAQAWGAIYKTYTRLEMSKINIFESVWQPLETPQKHPERLRTQRK